MTDIQWKLKKVYKTTATPATYKNAIFRIMDHPMSKNSKQKANINNCNLRQSKQERIAPHTFQTTEYKEYSCNYAEQVSSKTKRAVTWKPNASSLDTYSLNKF